MPSPSSPRKLPESLSQQIQAFRSRLWKVKIIEAVFSGLIGFFVSYLLLFVSDRIWATPPEVSLIILVAGSAVFFLFVPYWLHRWVWKRRLDTQLARLIAQKYPDLGDRILGVVELESAESRTGALLHSRELMEAAVKQVSDEAKDVDFMLAIPHPWHKKALVAFSLLLGLLVLLAGLVPEASLNALKRWLMPATNVPRYTFTMLDKVPEVIYVPMGEAFEIKATQSSQSKITVDSARVRSSKAIDLTAPFHKDEQGTMIAEFLLPGMLEESILHLEAGDARYDIRIIPSMRPNLDDLQARISYPDYTARKEEVLPVKTGTLYAVEGSAAVLRAKSTTPLASASYTDAQGKEHKLAVSGNYTTFPLMEMRDSSEIHFQWTDERGLKAHSPFKVRLEAIPDQTPDTFLQGPSREIYLLEKESVELDILCADDYGIMEVGVEWNGSQVSGQNILLKGAPDQARLNTKFVFHAQSMGIKPQRLLLNAIAKDYKPGRDYKRSSPITLYVLSKNEHAQMIKSSLEQISATLEELSQQEQLLTDESARLKQKPPEELITPEIRNTLNELADSEKAHAEKLNDILNQLSELFKKAARNEEIESESLRPFFDARGILEKLPDGSLKNAQDALNNAAERNNTPEKTAEEIDTANKEQQKSLDQLNSALEKLRESSENLESGTFIARLKKAARQERQILELLVTSLNRLIGISPESLDPKDKREIDRSSSAQKEVIRDLYWISDDLKHFYLRSKVEAHQKIAQEMSNLLMEKNMDELAATIARNHSAKSIEQIHDLETTLLKWIGMMEGNKKKSEAPGGGGQGKNNQSMSESDFDFMLKVMRMIQSQQDIRSRTRILEEEKKAESTEKNTSPSPDVQKEDTPK